MATSHRLERFLQEAELFELIDQLSEALRREIHAQDTREMEPEAASAAGDEPGGEPPPVLLDLPAELVGELLSFAQPKGLLRMRHVNKACHDVHVPLAQRIIRQRLEATVTARGHCKVAAGTGHTVCVRPGDGAPYSWGYQPLRFKDLHYLGQGQATGPPVRLPAPMVGLGGVAVREVAVGSAHTLLLGACGGVWSCGIGSDICKHGRLGHGDEADHATPRRIDGLAQVRAVQVAAGGNHSLVLSAAGYAYSFGHGTGRLGRRGQNNQPLLQRIGPLRHTRICQLVCGEYHSLAVGEEGELYSWGDGSYGQLGLGHGQIGWVHNKLLPARVVLPAGVRIRQASAGDAHSLAVATDGGLYSFGRGIYGQLGHGDEKDRWMPTLVEALAGTSVRSAAAGEYHSVVRTEAGAVLTFGSNEQGQLGLGEAASVPHVAWNRQRRLVPTAVAALAGKEVAEVAAGHAYTVVRLADGELRAFGHNRQGQLGTGEAEERLWLPTKVALPEPPKCPAGSSH